MAKETNKKVEDELVVTLPMVENADEVIANIEAESSAKKETIENIQKQIPKEKMYSASDVDAMFAQFKKELKGEDVDQDDEIDGKRKSTARMSRFKNHFIVAFKNINSDPYFPDRTIYAQDVFNEQTRQMVPHITFILDDGQEVTAPFETMLKVVNKVDCEIIERIEKDVSFKYGTIERKELKGTGYNEEGTGDFVQGKAVQKSYTYKIKLPDGREFICPGEVLNW